MLPRWRWENSLVFISSYCVALIVFGPMPLAVYAANENDVLRKITWDYNKNVRPVRNIRTPTVVSIELKHFNLLSMNEKEETITFISELELAWKDELVQWNSSAFDDIPFVVIPDSLLWGPDIFVISGLNVNYMLPQDKRFLKVHSDGSVRSSSPCHIINQCVLKIEEFPFDVQTCQVALGSWMYAHSQIELIVGQKSRNPNTTIAGYNKFQGNGEWSLLSFEPSLIDYMLGTETLLWTEVAYTVQLKRRPIYYICVLLIPTFMTATICLFGLFVPATNTGERIEKVNMGLATLLSMAVILGIVAGEMPKTATMPLLGTFVLAELLLCAVGVGVSMVIMVAHQRASTRCLLPPRWLKAIIFFEINTKGAKSKNTNMMTAFNKEQVIQLQSKDHGTSDQIESIHSSILTCAKRLKQVLYNVEKYVDDKKFEDYILLQWIIIFDRIDTFFLVFFNVVNVIMTNMLLFNRKT